MGIQKVGPYGEKLWIVTISESFYTVAEIRINLTMSTEYEMICVLCFVYRMNPSRLPVNTFVCPEPQDTFLLILVCMLCH
jgi:hypothetical protein